MLAESDLPAALKALPARDITLLGMGAPVEDLDAADRKRIAAAEAMRRWRARHPDLVKLRNRAQYLKHREKRLEEKRRARYGRNRAAFLERHRRANARYYARKRSGEGERIKRGEA